MKLVSLPISFSGTMSQSGEMLINKIQIAMANGSDAINCALSIERNCVDIIRSYFHPLPSKEGINFVEWIILSSSFSFEQKRKVLFQIIDELQLLKNNDRTTFEKSFAKVLEYRNAFAHGTVHQEEQKIFIKYYKGGPIQKELSDEYWTELEGHFKSCIQTTTDLYEILVRHQKQKRQQPELPR